MNALYLISPDREVLVSDARISRSRTYATLYGDACMFVFADPAELEWRDGAAYVPAPKLAEDAR